MADTHRYVGNHPQEINGVMRAPGDFVELTAEDLKDTNIADMIEIGVLMSLKGGDKT